MAGISGKTLAFEGPESKKKYQQYEFNSNFDLNFYESFYRTHDPQIGRFLQIDPKPDYSSSLYVAMNNNPIKFSDYLGDSSVIDKNGYVLHYDAKDKDLRVFMQDGKKMELVGELGGKINAGKWFKNLLNKNAKTADGIWNPVTFYNYVKKEAVGITRSE
ncbi:MAG: hypothetical protein DI535_05860 [Citrobacter freundii]|nr:MAG: hypothetical protein DI535_05860 [Citrobacter freundii]